CRPCGGRPRSSPSSTIPRASRIATSFASPTMISPNSSKRAGTIGQDFTRPKAPSSKPRAGFDLGAAQEFFRPHRLPSGALHLGEPHGAVAAGDGQRTVERRAGDAFALASGRAQRLNAHAADLEPGAGIWRQAANVVVHLLPRLGPIDPSFVLADLGRGGYAHLGLRRERQ